MLALILENEEEVNHLVIQAKEKNLILFWLLFEPQAVRISPPLTISNTEIEQGCAVIIDILNGLLQ